MVWGKSKDVTLPENYTFEKLVENAIMNAVPHTAGESERWVAIRDTFATGATIAHEICEAYGLDPFEKVSGVHCLTCDP